MYSMSRRLDGTSFKNIYLISRARIRENTEIRDVTLTCTLRFRREVWNKHWSCFLRVITLFFFFTHTHTHTKKKEYVVFERKNRMLCLPIKWSSVALCQRWTYIHWSPVKMNQEGIVKICSSYQNFVLGGSFSVRAPI